MIKSSWKQFIKGLDKLEKRDELKEIYNQAHWEFLNYIMPCDPEWTEDMNDSDFNPLDEIHFLFKSPSDIEEFLFECAKENLPGAKEKLRRIRQINTCNKIYSSRKLQSGIDWVDFKNNINLNTLSGKGKGMLKSVTLTPMSSPSQYYIATFDFGPNKSSDVDIPIDKLSDYHATCKDWIMKGILLNSRKIQSMRTPKNVYLNEDTQKLIQRLEKRVGHELKLKFEEDNTPYVEIEKLPKGGYSFITKNYLNKLAENFLYDGYKENQDSFIVYLDPSIMYTRPGIESSRQIKSSILEYRVGDKVILKAEGDSATRTVTEVIDPECQLQVGDSVNDFSNNMDYLNDVYGGGRFVVVSSKQIKSSFAVKIIDRHGEEDSYSWVNGDKYNASEPEVFDTKEEAQSVAREFNKFFYDEGLGSFYWTSVVEYNGPVKSSRQIQSSKSQEEFENLVIDIEDILGVNVEHGNIFNLNSEMDEEIEYVIDDICRQHNCKFVPVNGSRWQYRLIQSSRQIKSELDDKTIRNIELQRKYDDIVNRLAEEERTWNKNHPDKAHYFYNKPEEIKSSIITPWDTNQVTGTSDEDLGLSAVVDIYGNEFVNVDERTLNELKDTLVRYFDDDAYVRDWNINNPDYQIEDAFDVTDPEEMDVEDLARYFDYEAYGRDIRLEDNMVWDSENQYWVSAHDVNDEELNNDKYIFMRG